MAEAIRVVRSARSDATLLSVEGLLDALGAAQFLDALELALTEPRPVVIDLTGLTAITGTGLGALAKAEARSATTGRRVTLENVPGPLNALLTGSGLLGLPDVSSPPADVGRSFSLSGWMPPMAIITVSPLPAGIRSLNVSGRRPSGLVRGFGPLWQKTYTLRVPAGKAEPTAIVDILRSDLPALQPPANQFYPVGGKVAPGSVVLIGAKVMGLPVRTGVVVMHSDENEFSLLTPQGHPESGWVTFSARYDNDDMTRDVIVQIESLARASDPVYEFSLRFLGAGSVQEGIWRHVLGALAARLDVPPNVAVDKRVIDGRMRWSRVGNLLYNAGAWTALNALVGRA